MCSEQMIHLSQAMRYGEQYEGQSVVSDGWMYAYISNGFIQAYDSNTGRIVWGYNAGYGFLGIEP
jgi:outer membrane protein assembly factor BamB